MFMVPTFLWNIIAKNAGLTRKNGLKSTPNPRKKIELVDFVKAVYN